jgi:hypothetical protein
MAVEVTANGAAFEPGIPQRLFEIASTGWDVTGDGQRFLIVGYSSTIRLAGASAERVSGCAVCGGCATMRPLAL